MAEGRPAIPRELERAVLVEAGHRCAIPTCRQAPVEIHHIVPWAKVKKHDLSNLIALCPTDHARAERGDIDRKSLVAYKQNLGLLTSRYGDMEHRLLDLFAKQQTNHVTVGRGMDFEFMYLLQDGLMTREQHAVMKIGSPSGTFSEGPTTYTLTDRGVDFVTRLTHGDPLVEDCVPLAAPSGQAQPDAADHPCGRS